MTSSAPATAEDQRVAASWADFWHYKRIGLYGQQLQHLYSVFPREQVLVLRYRDLIDDPAGTLDRICGFLGVSQGVIDHLPRENVTAHPELTRRHQYMSQRPAGRIGGHRATARSSGPGAASTGWKAASRRAPRRGGR